MMQAACTTRNTSRMAPAGMLSRSCSRSAAVRLGTTREWVRSVTVLSSASKNPGRKPAGASGDLAIGADQRLDGTDAGLVEERALAGVDVGWRQAIAGRHGDLGDRVIALQVGLLVHGGEH